MTYYDIFSNNFVDFLDEEKYRLSLFSLDNDNYDNNGDGETALKENELNVEKSKKDNKQIIEVEEHQSTDSITMKIEAKSKIEQNSVINTPKEEKLNDELNIVKLKGDLIPLLKKKRGRAKKGKNEDVHNKYSDDNMRRKCKHVTLENIMNFINDKIKEKYEGKIGKGILTKKLLIINQNQTTNATILFNKNFLNKTVENIFSENISTRYTNYPPEHNRYVISSLINDDDNEERKKYFTNLFNLTFIECLKHFRGSLAISELEGLTPFDQIDLKSKVEPDYWKVLKYYIDNYETITNNKRERK